MQRRLVLAGLAGVAGAGAACSPSLGLFDALAPRDGGARQVLAHAAYGAHPRQRLDLYAPTAASGSMPIVVFFYGGSWNSGEKDDYNFIGSALAAQGFIAAVPNYRLVPEVRFPTFLEDSAAAVRWVAEHAAEYSGDARRIVLVGHSAGAYNAMMLALDTRYLGRDVTVRGVAGLAGPYDFLPLDVAATREAFGQTQDLSQTQPAAFARPDAPPALLLWGDEDATVGRRSIETLSRAMRERGARVETKIYAGVDHIEIMLAMSRPFRGRAPVLADISAFVRDVTTA